MVGTLFCIRLVLYFVCASILHEGAGIHEKVQAKFYSIFLLVFVDLCAWGCKESERAWMQWEQEGVRFSKSVCESRGTMNEESKELLCQQAQSVNLS